VLYQSCLADDCETSIAFLRACDCQVFVCAYLICTVLDPSCQVGEYEPKLYIFKLVIDRFLILGLLSGTVFTACTGQCATFHHVRAHFAFNTRMHTQLLVRPCVSLLLAVSFGAFIVVFASPSVVFVNLLVFVVVVLRCRRRRLACVRRSFHLIIQVRTMMVFVNAYLFSQCSLCWIYFQSQCILS
jgi:hypothetical protein